MINKLDLEKYRNMSVNRLLVLVALFIVVIDNNSFWSKLWSALGSNPGSHSLFMLSFLILVFVLILVLLTLFSFPKIVKFVAILALILASITAYFIDNMHVMFSVSMFQNMFETDYREATELINLSIILNIIIFGVMPSILVWFIKIEKKSHSAELVSRLKLLSIILLTATLTVFWSYKDYSLVLRENRSLTFLINPVYPVVSLVKYFKKHSSDNNIVVTPVFEDAVRRSHVSAGNKKDILIIVVGETARAANFSLNGYARNTNPQLQKENIINYNNTSSCGTATAESVPCMFSDLTKESFSNDKAKRRENLLDGFKHAGIDVLWRDNNSSCKGVCVRVVSEDLRHMKVKELCNDEECHDEILLYKLDEYINGLKDGAVVVLHQMGSHGPAYYKRHPKEFSKFTPECNISSVHNCKQNEIVNSYDNTILYSDYFLSEVINYLKGREEDFNTAMIYMSDHGESLGENGIYLHGLPYFMAPEEQTHVPFIVWLSEDMQRQKNIDVSCLKNNSKQTHSHDNLLHSALGLMDVSTSAYDEDKDVFASCRSGTMVKTESEEVAGSSLVL